MKKITISVLLTVLIFSAYTPSAYAIFGGDIVFDPAGLAQQVMIYQQQYQQLQQMIQGTQNQLQMLTNQAQNLMNMPASIQQSVMNQIQSSLSTLGTIQSQSRSMTSSYSQMSSRFDQLYPGFAAYNGMSSTDYATRMQQWQQQTDNSTYDSMRAQGLADPAKVQSESNMINALIQASQSAQGALAAAQIGNQLCGLISQQLIEIKQILAAGFTAQASYIAQQSQDQQAHQSMGNSMMDGFATPGARTPADVMSW